MTNPFGYSEDGVAAPGMAMLEVRDLRVAYGKIEAVKGISFRVGLGEVVTLIGGNGAGKTTTLRTISGLMHPAKGSVTFAGQEITTMSAHKIVGLGICQSPEGRRLFPRMQVVDNLRMGAYTRKDKAGILEDMERVFTLFPRLKERETQLAGTLSGGEQQMLAIGRGLASAPDLLMLDEPSMGLAPTIVDAIFERIHLIHTQHGVTILLVEQRVAEALETCDRGYVLETGRVAMEGTHNTLMSDERVRRAYLGM